MSLRLSQRHFFIRQTHKGLLPSLFLNISALCTNYHIRGATPRDVQLGVRLGLAAFHGPSLGPVPIRALALRADTGPLATLREPFVPAPASAARDLQWNHPQRLLLRSMFRHGNLPENYFKSIYRDS